MKIERALAKLQSVKFNSNNFFDFEVIAGVATTLHFDQRFIQVAANARMSANRRICL